MSSTPPLLKPMTAGDILDHAIRLYRQNFVGLVTIVAVVNVPIMLVQSLFFLFILPLGPEGNSAILDPTSSGIMLSLGSVILVIAGSVLSLFQLGAITIYVSERFLGRPITVVQAYGRAWRRGLSLFIAALLLGLAIIGLLSALVGTSVLPVLIGALASTGGAQEFVGGAALITTLCLCILFVPALAGMAYLYTRWTFWTQGIMIENYNSTGGLGRSWKLVRGYFWRVLGFNALLAILAYFLVLGPGTALTMTTLFLPSPLLRFVIQSVTGGLVGIIVTPLQFATLTVLYYDLRIRKEGLDLQMQMQMQ